MLTNLYHIAIDGPVASGKGTAARGLSKLLGIPCLDTGAIYRGIAVFMRDRGIDYQNEAAVIANLTNLNMGVKIVDGVTHIHVNGRDVTHLLRDNDISIAVSPISTYKKVRKMATSIQQQIAKVESFILEGRDIGSVVLSDAKYKFFLTADIKKRALRRLNDLRAKGDDVPLNELIAQIETRDKTDREKGGFKQVSDAVVVDNTNMTIEETIRHMFNIIKSK